MDLKVIAVLLLCHTGWGVSLPALVNPDPRVRIPPVHVHVYPGEPYPHPASPSPVLRLLDRQPEPEVSDLDLGRHSAEGWRQVLIPALRQRRHRTTASKQKRTALSGSVESSRGKGVAGGYDIMQKRDDASGGFQAQDVVHTGSEAGVHRDVGPGLVHSAVGQQREGAAQSERNSSSQDPVFEATEQDEGGAQHASAGSSQRSEGSAPHHFDGPVFRGSVVRNNSGRSTVSLSPSTHSAFSESSTRSAGVAHLPPVLNPAQSSPHTLGTPPTTPLHQQSFATLSSARRLRGQPGDAVNFTSPVPQSASQEGGEGSMTAGSGVKAGELATGESFGLPRMPNGNVEELSSTSSTTAMTSSTRTLLSTLLSSQRAMFTALVRASGTQSLVDSHSTVTERTESPISPQQSTVNSNSNQPFPLFDDTTLVSVLTYTDSAQGQTEPPAPGSSGAAHSTSLLTDSSDSSRHSSSTPPHPPASTLALDNPAEPHTVADVEHPVFPVNTETSSTPTPLPSSLFPSTVTEVTSDTVLTLWVSSMSSVHTETRSTAVQRDSSVAEQVTTTTLLISTKQEEQTTPGGIQRATINDGAFSSHAFETNSVTEPVRPFTHVRSSASPAQSTRKSSARPTSEETTSSTQTLEMETSHGGNTTIKSDTSKAAEDLTESVSHQSAAAVTGPSSAVAVTTAVVSPAQPHVTTSTQPSPSLTTVLTTPVSTTTATSPSTTQQSTAYPTHLQSDSSESGSSVVAWLSSTVLSTSLRSVVSSAATAQNRNHHNVTTPVRTSTVNSIIGNANNDSKKESDNSSDDNRTGPPPSSTTSVSHVIHIDIHTPHNASHGDIGNKSGNNSSTNQDSNASSVTTTTTSTTTTTTTTSRQRQATHQSSPRPAHDVENSTLSPGTSTSTTELSSTASQQTMTTTSPGHSDVVTSSISAVVNPGLTPVYIGIKLKMTWTEFCNNEHTFCLELVDIVREDGQIESFTTDQIRILENPSKTCALHTSGRQEFSAEEEEIEVQLYLVNKSHHYDVNLTYVCAMLIQQGFDVREASLFNDRLIKVQLHELSHHHPTNGRPGSSTGDISSNVDNDDDDFIDEPGVTIVISISAVGGVCCGALIIMQFVLRRRYREGMRAFTNRSSSATSVDSIALNNVIKDQRHSGHFNPALDLAPERFQREHSHPLNFTQLCNFALYLEGIYEEFQLIPNKTPRLSVVPSGAEEKNRFANILPIPGTRVPLDGREEDEAASFINANYVAGYGGQSHTYIATQAPLDKTVGDLWSMVWQHHCPAIVMLINPVEDGHKKCASYFPDSAGPECAVHCGEFRVTMTRREVHQEYITSWLQVNNVKTGESQCVRHFWLTCWPLTGRPEPISLVRFVLDTRPLYEDSGVPLVVHCSNGTARTGVFVSLDVCMRQYEDGRQVDVMQCVYTIRQQRAGAVQTSQQYALLYQALAEYATILSSPVVSSASSASTLHAMLP